MKPIMPKNFKLIDLEENNIKGKLFGSSSPGYYLGMEDDETPGGSIEQNLLFLKKNNINTIICLDNTKNRTIQVQKAFKKIFNSGSTYLTEINGLSTIINDFQSPSIEQINVITKYSVDLLQNCKNVSLLIHCGAGIGRTGTILSSIVSKIKNYEALQSIEYIRDNYNQMAVETSSQIDTLMSIYTPQELQTTTIVPLLIKSTKSFMGTLNINKVFILNTLLCFDKKTALTFNNLYNRLLKFYKNIPELKKIKSTKELYSSNHMQEIVLLHKLINEIYDYIIQNNLNEIFTEKFNLSAQHNILLEKNKFDDRGNTASSFKFGMFLSTRMSRLIDIYKIIITYSKHK